MFEAIKRFFANMGKKLDQAEARITEEAAQKEADKAATTVVTETEYQIDEPAVIPVVEPQAPLPTRTVRKEKTTTTKPAKSTSKSTTKTPKVGKGQGGLARKEKDKLQSTNKSKTTKK